MRWPLILAALALTGCATAMHQPGRVVLKCNGVSVAEAEFKPGLVTLLAPEGCKSPTLEVHE